MDRDALIAIVEELALDGVDRRSKRAMAAKLSRTHRATPILLLNRLGESDVKTVCELMGLSTIGRKKVLLEVLLNSQTPRKPKKVYTHPHKQPRTLGAERAVRDDNGVDTKNDEFETAKELRDAEPPVHFPETPFGMMRITKTELVWPGKYNEDGTIRELPQTSLPFQVIERVNESRATREARKGQTLSLFDIYEGQEGDSFEAGWRNKLIWGDNFLVMGSLLENFSGKIDLIYIDPPFATGADFSFTTEIGDRNIRLDKEQSMIEEKAYRDTWGRGLISYLEIMTERITLIRALLKPEGHLLVHMAPGVSPHVRFILDSIFGTSNFRNEIVVNRPITKNLQRQFEVITALPQGHDVILWYSAQPNTRVSNLLVPYESSTPEGYWHRFWSGADRPTMRYELLGETPTHGQWKWERERALRAISNYERFLKEGGGRSLVQYWRDTGEELEFIRKSSTGTAENWFSPSTDKVGDTVWDDVKAYENRKDYATQKHEELLYRIVNWLSKPGDLVADFFCGSGTTVAVAEKLGRRWIGCDLGRWAIHVSRKRLLGIENCRPFEVLNLGKYERQYWQGVTFSGDGQKPVTEQALYEYLAFILQLYQAQPVSGMAHLHGKKGRAMVHIGAIDSPVTIDEINQALEECERMKQPELHVLGWEWEMGLAGPNNEYRKGGLMQDVARQKGVKLLLLQIPREVMERQAVERGEVQFFELAYVDVEIKLKAKLTVEVGLKDFVIPNTELIPKEVRKRVKKWSDYIDYWAVDWDFKNDTFMQGWVAYRTRKNRMLPVFSDEHFYQKPGQYAVLVKVIDIFGNDTSQAHVVEMK